MHVLKYCSVLDNFFDVGNAKNMTKTVHETLKFSLWFFTNHLKLANSITDIVFQSQLYESPSPRFY